MSLYIGKAVQKNERPMTTLVACLVSFSFSCMMSGCNSSDQLGASPSTQDKIVVAPKTAVNCESKSRKITQNNVSGNNVIIETSPDDRLPKTGPECAPEQDDPGAGIHITQTATGKDSVNVVILDKK